jgi:uncharacterized phiE125 gp8 family phage protein
MVSVTSFKTFDNDDNDYLFPADQYSVDTVGPRARIALRMGAVWPTTVLRKVNGIGIEAVYGYGNATKVPPPIKQAIKIMAGKLYENRGDDASEELGGSSPSAIPNTCLVLLAPFRMNKVHGV